MSFWCRACAHPRVLAHVCKQSRRRGGRRRGGGAGGGGGAAAANPTQTEGYATLDDTKRHEADTNPTQTEIIHNTN